MFEPFRSIKNSYGRSETLLEQSQTRSSGMFADLPNRRMYSYSKIEAPGHPQLFFSSCALAGPLRHSAEILYGRDSSLCGVCGSVADPTMPRPPEVSRLGQVLPTLPSLPALASGRPAHEQCVHADVSAVKVLPQPSMHGNSSSGRRRRSCGSPERSSGMSMITPLSARWKPRTTQSTLK